MQIIIDIDEDVKVAIDRMGLLRIPDEMQKKVDRAIQRSVPIPEHHGRLIDADALIDSLSASDRDMYCKAVIEENALTIIRG